MMRKVAVLWTLGIVSIACGASHSELPDAGSEMDAASGPDAESDSGSGADSGAPEDAGTDSGHSLVDAFVADATAGDAGEACPSEGMYRSRSCGCGGTVSEQCTGGFWQARSACVGATGECEMGEFETREEPNVCTVWQRVCDEFCYWGEWERVTPRNECFLGFVTCPDLSFPEGCVCNSMCQCEPNPDPTCPD